jgi:hypothetical protein
LGDGITPKAIWHVVKQAAQRAGIEKLAPHDLRSYAECRIMPNRYTDSRISGYAGIFRRGSIRHNRVTTTGSSRRPGAHHPVGNGALWHRQEQSC